MEVVVKNHGLEPNVNLVKEYVKETGNTFDDIEKLEEVERFAIWVACKKIPMEAPDDANTAQSLRANDSLPLSSGHICFDKGHNMFLICEIDNGRSKYGEHKCSRCGYTEPYQYDYGI